VPWYAYELHRDGQAFIDGFLIRHNLARYSSPLEKHGGSIGYYFVVLPLLLLPWAPLLASVVAGVRRHWADPMQRFLLVWGGFVLVFFSLSGTKLPHYVLYGASPFVLLMAMALVQAGTAMRAALTVCLLLLLALLCGSAATLHLWAPGVVKPPLYRALLLGQQASPWLVWISGMAALAVLFLMTQLSRPGLTLLWRSGSAAVLLSLVSLGVALPWWGDLLQGPIKRAAEVARQRPEPAVQWGLHQPSFAVYREQEAPRRAPGTGNWPWCGWTSCRPRWPRWAGATARCTPSAVTPSSCGGRLPPRRAFGGPGAGDGTLSRCIPRPRRPGCARITASRRTPGR
jgi:4-amino-4-deoxy-L-arabinose transferase-like glycosyltransferase